MPGMTRNDRNIERTYFVLSFIFNVALTGVALSAERPMPQKVKDAAQDVILCYNFGAIKYAVQTCEPASSITASQNGCRPLCIIKGRCGAAKLDGPLTLGQLVPESFGQ
jgi:hypothetical protein